MRGRSFTILGLQVWAYSRKLLSLVKLTLFCGDLFNLSIPDICFEIRLDPSIVFKQGSVLCKLLTFPRWNNWECARTLGSRNNF